MNYEKALQSPTSVFLKPEHVLTQKELSRDQKINILRRWEYDARELEVAEEENMGGGPPDMLQHVRNALNQLNAGGDLDHVSPTKQGGE